MAKTLLIIDDDKVIRLLLSDYFSALGYQIETCPDGASAIARAGLLKPDLIILDFQMPGMDGISVLRKLRAHPQLEKIPTIFLSGNSDTERFLASSGMEVSAVIYKPFELVDIKEKIESLTG